MNQSIKFDLDDICLMPAVISTIKSRSECNVKTPDGYLPLFVAPMDTVVNDVSAGVFGSYDCKAVVPRTIDINLRFQLSTNYFVAIGLNEVDDFISMINNEADILQRFVCIDVANGHMLNLIEICKDIKDFFHDRVILMTGNIANPDTYYHYAKAGIDFVRVSIGNGSCCTTSVCTGCFYPMGSLLEEVVEIKNEVSRHPDIYKSTPKIIADGGFNTFDRIIKALALGADYVMCGEIFAKSEEACGAAYWQYPDLTTLTWEEKQKLKYDGQHYGFHLRDYYGMSTKIAQKAMGKSKLKVEEGLHRYVHIEYPIEEWLNKFKSYLQSAMSYTNSKDLETFVKCKKSRISNAARKSFYK